MSGYLGTKAVLLSTTSATVGGDSSVGGDSTIGGDLTVDTNTLYVDSTNNRVGVGTSSPAKKLDVDTTMRVANAAGTSAAELDIGSGSTWRFRAQPTTGANAYGLDIVRGSAGTDIKMSIDSSGNLLVGKSSDDFAASGFEARPEGAIRITRNGDPVAFFNRLTSDGAIVNFYKDSSSVGSIVTQSGNIILASGSVGVGVGGDNLYPTNGSGASTDNVMDVGDASARFDDVYATNGTIQTSDQNEKQQIAALTDAEMTAAKAISKLFKTFKWNDSVTEKGDAARTHTGVIAQEVEQAMTDAGLNAGDYAFFISSDWTDEETGEERNRKGIRYPQLMSFIGAATEQRLASIEARLDALEGN